MKTKYKWIRFEKHVCIDIVEWLCMNKSDQCLGAVEYDAGWRQFVFIVSVWEGETKFNFRCLEDIADFLKQLNKTKGCYKEKTNEDK